MPRMVRSATGSPAGGQYPTYDSTSASGFIPQIWSPLLTEQFYPATVIGDIANTNYQSEIKGYGDSVVIRLAPQLTITDHEIGDDIWDDYEVPTSTTTLLEINQAKKFAFQLDDIDALQSDVPLMDEFVGTAGMNMATAVDASVLTLIQDDAAATNKGATAGAKSGNINCGTTGTPRAITKADVIDYILDLALVLDEVNVPRDMGSRYLVVPYRLLKLIKGSDLKDASLSGDAQSTLRNGRVGVIDDFTIYGSNNLPITGTTFNVLAGHRSALTFAAQVDQHTLEHLPNPRKFGKLCRGMTVYGHETVKDESMVNSFISIAA